MMMAQVQAVRKDTGETRLFHESMFYRNDFTLKTWIKIDGITFIRISNNGK
jgi:hypothetical protein